MIEIPLFYKFHTREYFSLSSRILQVFERYNQEELGVTEPVKNVQSAHDKLNEALTKAVSTELTSDVADADSMRDNAFVALKYYLLACQKSSKPERQQAADLLVTRVRHYGWTMNNASYSKQTTQTLNLLNDLETDKELIGAVKELTAKPWVAELKTTQLAFEKSLEVRTQAKANQVKITAEDASKEMRHACEALFKYIEALEIISPNESRKPMIDEINTVINEFNTMVKTRQSRLDNASDEDISVN